MARFSLLDHFSALDDPRQRGKVVYPLPEMMLLVLCATLAGAEDFVEIRLWGRNKLRFLRGLLPFALLPVVKGIASHDTLNDVLNALDCDLFASLFTHWVEDLRADEPGAAKATPCIWSQPGRRASVCCWARRQPMPSPMKSRPSQPFSSVSSSRVPW
jgi:DDE_Tnp_1-associated